MSEARTVAAAIMLDAGYTRVGDQWVIVPTRRVCQNTLAYDHKRPFRSVIRRVEPDPYERPICSNSLYGYLRRR